MSNLPSAIEKAAEAFAKEIVAAVKGATLQELLALQGVAVAAPAKRRGRPPKAEAAKRKPGRPPKAEAAKRKPGRPRKTVK
jgi:ribosomal protein L12E/L44/L45/RPP1/RPP2